MEKESDGAHSCSPHSPLHAGLRLPAFHAARSADGPFAPSPSSSRPKSPPLLASFTFDGDSIPIHRGDTIGSALHRDGVRVVSRSLKYHRPRGLYCCAGSCASCFVDVDGVPNVPACMKEAAGGMHVRSQNRMGSAKHDLFGVVDKVYPKGFDPHNMFTKPRVMNEIFLRTVRFMSGLGRPPTAAATAAGATPAQRHTMKVDELILGAGASGLQRAHEAGDENPEGRILIVDEFNGLGGSARWDPLEADTHKLAAQIGAMPNISAWTQAVCFGLYRDEAPDGGILAAVRRAGEHGEDLWEIEAHRITVCTGTHDAWPVFANNDLPGILSARGARRLLGEHGVLPGKRIVVHGAPLEAAFIASLEAAGATVVATGTVTDARGMSHVTSANVAGAGGGAGSWHDCDTIVCNIPGTPRIELLQQAGCALGFREAGGGQVLAARVDHGGSTSVPGVYVREGLAVAEGRVAASLTAKGA